MEQIGLLRLRLQTGTNPFSFLLFTKTGDVDNTSRSVETRSLVHPRLYLIRKRSYEVP